MDFNKSKTKQNLARSFAAECQAGARYQFMATQAQMEKLLFIKDTMKMLAKNEMAHAKLFYDYIADKCGEKCEVDICADYPFVEASLENSLKQEAKIEKDEFEKIYPEFAKVAKNEGFDDVAESFELVAAVEKTHAGILNYLYEHYLDKSLYKYKNKVVQKCSNCGHIAYTASGWKKCPLCNFDQGAIQISFAQILESSLGVKSSC